jgi:hypothetical protein
MDRSRVASRTLIALNSLVSVLGAVFALNVYLRFMSLHLSTAVHASLPEILGIFASMLVGGLGGFILSFTLWFLLARFVIRASRPEAERALGVKQDKRPDAFSGWHLDRLYGPERSP